MRVRHRSFLRISEDAAQRERRFGGRGELAEALADSILDGEGDAIVGVVNLANGATFDLPFGSLELAHGLFLQATGNFDVKLSGTGPTLSARRATATATGGTKATRAKLLAEVLATSARVTALEALQLTYAAWGDRAL